MNTIERLHLEGKKLMVLNDIKVKLETIIQRPRSYFREYQHADVANAIQDRARVEAIALWLEHGFKERET